jgi:hypothetical protein
MIDSNTDPWLQQPQEPKRAYLAFDLFRSLGADRTLRAVKEKISATRGTLKQWYEQFNWSERVRLYDNHVDRLRIEAEIEEIREMRKRHIRIAMAIQGVVSVELNKKLQAAQTTATETLDAREISDLLKIATTLERISRGEPETLVQASSQVGIGNYDLVLVDNGEIEDVAPIDRDNQATIQ